MENYEVIIIDRIDKFVVYVGVKFIINKVINMVSGIKLCYFDSSIFINGFWFVVIICMFMCLVLICMKNVMERK